MSTSRGKRTSDLWRRFRLQGKAIGAPCCAPYQEPCIWVERFSQHLHRRSHFYHCPGRHDADPVSDLTGQSDIMGHKEHGQPREEGE